MPEIQLLICQIDDMNVPDAVISIERTVDIIHARDGTIFHICGPLVIATFDFGHAKKDDCWRDRVTATVELNSVLASKIKVLHGAVVGDYANVGGNSRISFGPVIPSFGRLFQRLLGLQFGATELI